jgi:hypothetical protein
VPSVVLEEAVVITIFPEVALSLAPKPQVAVASWKVALIVPAVAVLMA